MVFVTCIEKNFSIHTLSWQIVTQIFWIIRNMEYFINIIYIILILMLDTRRHLKASELDESVLAELENLGRSLISFNNTWTICDIVVKTIEFWRL